VRVLWLGVPLTIAVTAILVLAYGNAAIIPGLAFGGLATAIQVAAVMAVQPVMKAPLREMMVRWGWGMGLRLLGVVLFAVAVLIRPDIFPPLPTAFGYVGVLIPLLFLETRLLR
jgi:hypothetical protein